MPRKFIYGGHVGSLEIVQWPDPILTQPAEEITCLDDDLVTKLKSIQDFVQATPHCGGLAGPQVGMPLRFFVTEQGIFINPKLVNFGSETEIAFEGCMSMSPDTLVPVERFTRCWVVYTTIYNRMPKLICSPDKYTARLWQHEMDHLDGITILQKGQPVT